MCRTFEQHCMVTLHVFQNALLHLWPEIFMKNIPVTSTSLDVANWLRNFVQRNFESLGSLSVKIAQYLLVPLRRRRRRRRKTTSTNLKGPGYRHWPKQRYLLIAAKYDHAYVKSVHLPFTKLCCDTYRISSNRGPRGQRKG